MQSRKVVGGVGAVGVLALVAAFAVVQGYDVLLALVLIALLAATAVLSLAVLLTQRRVGRQVAYIMRKGIPKREGGETPSAPEVEKADILGLVRLMQAQYLGRLDRAQDALERAAQQLGDGSEPPSPMCDSYEGAGAVLSISQPDDHYAEVIQGAIRAGVPVIVEAESEDLALWVEERGWSDSVVVAPLATRPHSRAPEPSSGSAPAAS